MQSKKRNSSKSRTLYALLVAVFASLSLTISHQLFAAPSTNDLLALSDLSERSVASIASLTPTYLSQQPASVTVITRADMERVGARTLADALQLVPGLHVGLSDQGALPKFKIRGISSAWSSHILFMVDGVPQRSLGERSSGILVSLTLMHNVSRVEVIRGGGSTQYGADAFSGVVNIVTFDSRGALDSGVGMGVGQFNTSDFWIRSLSKFDGIDTVVAVTATTTDGWRGEIPVDRQTGLDQQYGTSLSNAPGELETSNDGVSGKFGLYTRNASLVFRLEAFRNTGTGPGTVEILDPTGRLGMDRSSAEFKYNFPLNATESIEFNTYYSYAYQLADEPLKVYPPGSFNNSFPDGVLGEPEFRESSAGAFVRLETTHWVNHHLTATIGGEYLNLYHTSDTLNYFPDLTPRGSVVYLTDSDDLWLRETHRANTYVALSDAWNVDESTQLSFGTRFDSYSDFGDVWSPRIALMYAFSQEYSFLANYTFSFRAPTGQEMGLGGGPIIRGNENLDPERIRMAELALRYQPWDTFLVTHTLYTFVLEAPIVFEREVGGPITRPVNGSSLSGNGYELEVRYENDAILSLISAGYNNRVGDISQGNEFPTVRSFAQFGFKFRKHDTASIFANYTGDQARGAGDIRPPLKSSWTLGASVRIEILPSVFFRLRADNLFDHRVTEPSRGPVPSIPSDYPLPGRTVFASLFYTF